MSADAQDWSGVNVSPSNLSDGFSEVKLTTPLDCGTVVLAHHGMIHRASARLQDDKGHPWRPMMKFIFSRRSEPGGSPSWAHEAGSALPPWEEFTTEPALIPAMQSTWEWMLGQSVPPADSEEEGRVQKLRETLLAPWEAGDEGRRVGAAYRLGRVAASSCGQQALQALMQALTHPERHAARRSAVHGLQAAGEAAVPLLVGHMHEQVALGQRENNFEAIMLAGDALGEAPVATLEVVAAMRAALECLSSMATRSERMQRWAAGLAKREQWQSDVDTAATSIMLGLQPLALRAVALDNTAVGVAIFEAVRPFLLPESAKRSAEGLWERGNSHLHGFNSGDVVGAAVNVGASLMAMGGVRDHDQGACVKAIEAEAAEGELPQRHSAQASLQRVEGEPHIA